MEIKLTPVQERELAVLDRGYNDAAEVQEQIMRQHARSKESAAYIRAKQEWLRCRAAHTNARAGFFRKIQADRMKKLEENTGNFIAEMEKLVHDAVTRTGYTWPDAEFLAADEIAEIVSAEMHPLTGVMIPGNREKVRSMVRKAADEAAGIFASQGRHGIRTPLPPLSAMALMCDPVNLDMAGKEFEYGDGIYRLELPVLQVAGYTEDVVTDVLFTMEHEYDGPVMFTAFDYAVYCTVSTCYNHVQNQSADSMLKSIPMFITPQEIWRMMNGITNDRSHPSGAQVRQVRESMNKMRNIMVTMDLEDELRNNFIWRDGERITDSVIHDRLMDAEESSFRAGGRLLSGYRINKEPVLYSYNYAKGNLLFVPYDLLDTSASVGNGGNTAGFRIYLLQQLLLMNHGYRKDKKVLYSAIYKNTGIPSPAERVLRSACETDKSYERSLYKEAKKDRDKIDSILSNWTDKKFIKGFTRITGPNNRFRGVEIILRPGRKHSISIR